MHTQYVGELFLRQVARQAVGAQVRSYCSLEVAFCHTVERRRMLLEGLHTYEYHRLNAQAGSHFSPRSADVTDHDDVTIRALAEADIPEIIEACSGWKELAQFGPPFWRPRSEAELKRKIAVTAGPEVASDYNFVLVADDGRLVGECSVHGIDWRNRVAQIGISIWRPADRRKGYGAVALREMEEFAFGYLGLERVEGWIVATNTGSLRLVEGAGWACEGTLRSRYVCGGERLAISLMARNRCRCSVE